MAIRAWILSTAVLFGCAPTQAPVANPEPVRVVLKPGTYSLIVDSVNGNPGVSHEFTLLIDCSRSVSGSGRSNATPSTAETIHRAVAYDGVISFSSSYDSGGYTWNPSFALLSDGTLAFKDGRGPDDVYAATGRWSVSSLNCM